MLQHTFRPENGPLAPDTVVVSYYPLGGNDENTGPRYQQEATLTGFDIIGITRPGSNTTAKNPLLREDFSPQHFDEKWRGYTGDLDGLTADYDYVIVRGQSTGSFPALNVVKNGLIKATHLLLEDGVNLRRRRGPIAARYDWGRNFAGEQLRKPQPTIDTWKKPAVNPRETDLITGLKNMLEGLNKFAVEQYHWEPLWRSNYSWRTSLDIVRTRPDLAIRFIFLGHSATGTGEDIDDFCRRVEKVKLYRAPEHFGDEVAPVGIKYFPDAWHGFLEYPEFGAANLLAIRQMSSLVTR